MNKNIKFIILLLIASQNVLFGLHFQPVGLDTIKESVMPTTSSTIKFFFGEDSAQKQEMLDALKIEYKTFCEKLKQLTEIVDKQIYGIKKDIDQLKSMYNYESNDFLSKKLNLLNKKYQTLPDIRETRQQIAECMKQHIEYLDKYFQSLDIPTDRIEEKSLYSFADLQKLTHKISFEREALTRLQTKKENEESIISRTEGFILSKDKEIKAINESIESFKKINHETKNQLIIWDLEKESLILEKELYSLRIEEKTKSIDFITSQVFVVTHKLSNFETDLSIVRSRIKVDKQDMLQYQHENNETKKEVQLSKVDVMKKRADLTAQKIAQQEELDKICDRYKISLSNIRQIEDWDLTADTIKDDFGILSASLVQTQITSLDQKIEEIKIQLFMLDAKLAHAQALEESVRFLYDITQLKSRDADQLEKIRTHYKDLKNSIQNTIKLHQDHTNELHAVIKAQYKKVINIKKYQERIRSYSSDEITANQKKYNECVALLAKALKSVEQQSDVYLKLIEKYTALIEQSEETLVLANFMLQELDLIGVWYRSNHAVTWQGIKQIVPNLITFGQNVYGVFKDYIVNYNFYYDFNLLTTTSVSQLFLYILLIMLLCIIYASFLAVLPIFYHVLMLVPQDMQGLFLLSRLFAVICGFVEQSLSIIFFWIFVFILLSFYQFSIAFTLLFYALSIVFLTYLSRKFLLYLLKFNRAADFVLLGESFEDRFRWIFSFFSISIIFILLFRKMFMLIMMYQQSEFPIILLRLYHVVIFISVVFSVEKDEFLNLIPKSNIYSEALSNFIDRYYYVLSMFFIGMLILSDPYLGGYGHLIWYIIFNSTMTILFCAIIYFFHNAVKSISSWLFFKENGEFGVKERFEYAKTWYAAFVVVLFFGFIIGTVLFVAQIWGYPIAFEQINRFMNHPLFVISGAAGSNVEYIRVAGFIRLIASVFSGILIAFLFRRYVLQRIFDIQYVDPGIQDTVMTISRYIIITLTIFIALQQEGLGFLVGYILGIGLVTFGWTFKDLFADVVAYFFILVQRQIKVGDFIKLDDHVLGVVKKIGPRAVILRRKNSVTIVVPNSTILKSAVYNWNYTRGYLAFDDIIFSVPFECDPTEIKKLLYQIVEKNTDVLKVPEPLIRLDDFSDKGYTFMVRGFISSNNTLIQWTIASDIRLAIVVGLRAKGIEIAEPIMRVKMKQ